MKNHPSKRRATHPKNCRTCHRVRKRSKKEYGTPLYPRKGSVMYRRMCTFMADKDFDDWMCKIQLGEGEPGLHEEHGGPA